LGGAANGTATPQPGTVEKAINRFGKAVRTSDDRSKLPARAFGQSAHEFFASIARSGGRNTWFGASERVFGLPTHALRRSEREFCVSAHEICALAQTFFESER
jgi:hypothetical protein